jgi:hypothetical protein
MIVRAWFQRMKLKHDEPISNVDFHCNLRRYNPVCATWSCAWSKTGG